MRRAYRTCPPQRERIWSERSRTTALWCATAVVFGALTACASGGDVEPAGTAVIGAPAPGTSTPVVPVPGSTAPASSLDPSAGIPAGLSLTVIAAVAAVDAAQDTETAIAELNTFADAHDASVTVFAIGPGEVIDPDTLLHDALVDEPDVVVVLGGNVLSALDRVSASNLGQQFLVLGAQLPEPTENVTAVIWPGADARASDGTSSVLALP